MQLQLLTQVELRYRYLNMSFIKYTFPTIDAQSRAVSRTLLQFRDKVVFQSVLAAFISQIQELIDAITDVMRYRTPAEASGVNLEIIGDIVGCLKVAFDYGRLNWFTPDNANYTPDASNAWVENSPIGTTMIPDDGLYRKMIEFKVFRNFTKYGSIPEIQNAIYTAFGVNVSFQAVDGSPMDWNIIISKNTPQYIQNFLTTASSNDQVTDVYWPPYPMTWRITGILYLEDL